MRSHVIGGISVLAALAAVVVIPWLAYREAYRQAYDATADLTRMYSRDVLHRADETGRQAQAAIDRLKLEKDAPCAPSALAVMRELDLTSTYVQAVGYMRDGMMVCSSLGTDPLALGTPSFRTLTGVTFYLNIQGADPTKSPLMALERDNFVVLVHRDLPLATTASIPAVSLAILHLDSGRLSPELVKGEVNRAWLGEVANRSEATFVTPTYLVTVTRSREFRIAAVAAIPIAFLHERTRTVAKRLVPAGVLAGLAVAVAIISMLRQQRSVVASLRYGLRHDEFFLLYQPIVEMATGRIVGAEALLRWRRMSGEQIGPELFISVAEQAGLITRLTERVLQLVEADAGAFLASRADFHIAINLSAADLASHAIIDLFETVLERNGARPSNFIVEITERSLLDIENATPVIARLRDRGIEVAIDDFGTGYSSLSYIESLDLDFLKIDRSFIEAIGTRAPTSQVVAHIIAMAKAMKLRIIAEGVESDAQADFLRANEVQYAQGWLFGKPMHFDEILALLASDQPAMPAQRRP